MKALSYIGADKITFPPKPDRHTNRHTYVRTDISVYRVALLLKIAIKHKMYTKEYDYNTLYN